MNTQELVNSAISYGQKGNLKKATKYLNRALKKEPENPIILYNLGFAYQQAKNSAAAINCYRKILKLEPGNLDVYLNLGRLYQDSGQLEKAAKIYEKALKIEPNSAEVYNNLGLTYLGLDNIKKAISCYKKAIKINPSLAKAHANLASVYYLLNGLNLAARYYKKAIKLDPTYFKARNLLGLTYLAQGKNEKAVEAFIEILKVKPDQEGTIFNLGTAYRVMKNHVNAVYCFREAVNLYPDYFEALAGLYQESRSLCDWSQIDALNTKLEAQINLDNFGEKFPGETPFDNITRSDNPEENYKIASLWSKVIESQLQSVKPEFNFSSYKKKKRKLRIGYLSNDYANHPMGYLVQHLFKGHSRNNFEIFAYSYGLNDHSLPRRETEKNADHFVDILKIDNIKAAKRIYRDKIDILVDLMGGYTRDSRVDICALKPAPIQINYMGFPGTMGADFMDYIITDRIITPPDETKYYAEKFIYMPNCYQVNGDYDISSKTFARKDFGLPEESVVFASFNRPDKIDPEIYTTWMNILRKVPKSVLWIYAHSHTTIQNNLIKEAKKRGVSAKRIVFAGKLPLYEHLVRLKLADLILDTKTYSGGATTSQALYMGVPVLTLTGRHYLSRMSTSLVTAAGLPQLAVNDLRQYEDLAVELSKNPKKLQVLRLTLNANKKSGPMFKPEIFIKNLEKAYLEIFNSYKNGKNPRQIDVYKL